MNEFKTMTNEELAEHISLADTWDLQALEELCERADLTEEWETVDEDGFERLVYRAADILGVEI